MRGVLVTGGAGFLGSHIVDLLGHETIVPSQGHWDLRYQNEADRMFYEFRPEVVINCAASVGGIKANLAHPGKFFYDNLAIGMNLLESARHYEVKKFVQIGSACEYPVNTQLPMRESDIWEGYPEPSNAPYAIAKRALLTMGQAYREEYGMNVIHLVPTNLYGPRDNFNLETSHVIPALIVKMLSGAPSVEILGDGSATRDFLYVDDAAHMIVTATAAYDSSKPLNLGSGSRVTISQLAATIKRLTGFTGELIFGDRLMNGQPDRILDTTRADHLGIAASTRLEEGLKETIAWYRNAKSR
jgi:GDP-L-fucose synthase